MSSHTTMGHHIISTRMAIIRNYKIARVSENVEKSKPYILLVEIKNGSL
jgi:hypothetical protein